MTLRTSLFSLVVVMGLQSLHAETILAPGSSWEYTKDNGATWHIGNAPFGNTAGGDFGANTSWTAGADLKVRTQIDLTGFDLTTIHWDLGVDNGFDLFANGNFVAGANAEGFTARWEYSGSIPGGFLHSGLNTIFVDLEDHGGATAFDMQIIGQRSTGVPESGSTSFFLATSLLALAGFRKRVPSPAHSK